MAYDATAIADGIQKSGGYYIAGLCVVAMAVVFWLFKASMDGRIADLKAEVAAARAETVTAREAFRGHLAEANAQIKVARENETAALRSVIPLLHKMDAAISAAEAKSRKRSDASGATSLSAVPK